MSKEKKEKKLTKKQILKMERQKTLEDYNQTLSNIDTRLETAKIALDGCNQRLLAGNGTKADSETVKLLTDAYAKLEETRAKVAKDRADLLKEIPKDKTVLKTIITAIGTLVTAIAGVFCTAYVEDNLGKLVKKDRLDWFKKKC